MTDNITLRFSTPISSLPTYNSLDVELQLEDWTAVVDVLEAHGFSFLTVEEDNDVDVHTYRHPSLGDVDVSVWYVVPDDFAPISIDALQLPA